MKNNFQKFNKVPLLISLIFFSFSLATFVFLYTKIQTNHKISKQLEADWRSEASKREETKTLDRSLKMLEEERALLEKHFIKSSDVVPFLDMVEKMAPKVGAKAEISLVDLSKDNSSLTVEMKATGQFEAVYKFLTLLENSPYELDFMLISMQRLGEVNPDGGVQSALWSGIFKVKLLSFIQ